MVKQTTKDIRETQAKFDEAFEHWKKYEDRKSWDTMFFVLLKVVKNVASSMMKEKALFPKNFYEKSVDVVLNIMRLYIIKKREPVKFLGSFVRGYIMNVFWKNYEDEDKYLYVDNIDNYKDVSYTNEVFVEVQSKLFDKNELIEAIRSVVLPTQIKKIIENRV